MDSRRYGIGGTVDNGGSVRIEVHHIGLVGDGIDSDCYRVGSNLDCGQQGVGGTVDDDGFVGGRESYVNSVGFRVHGDPLRRRGCRNGGDDAI